MNKQTSKIDQCMYLRLELLNNSCTNTRRFHTCVACNIDAISNTKYFLKANPAYQILYGLQKSNMKKNCIFSITNVHTNFPWWISTAYHIITVHFFTSACWLSVINKREVGALGITVWTSVTHFAALVNQDKCLTE